MPISFVEIYERGVSSFEDPSITNAYKTSPILFFKIMYEHLKNGIPMFNNPLQMFSILNDKIVPSGEIETFIGDGNTKTYTLTSTPLVDSYFEYIVDGITQDATYDYILNQVTFASNIPLGKTVSTEWYFAGQFNTLDIRLRADFVEKVEVILSQLLIANWSMKENNFLLDIRRLLNDTDYKMGSEANSIRAKGNWYYATKEDCEKLMNQLSWDMKFTTYLGY